MKRILALSIVCAIVLLSGCTINLGTPALNSQPTSYPQPSTIIVYVTVTPNPAVTPTSVYNSDMMPTATPTTAQTGPCHLTGKVFGADYGGIPNATVKLWAEDKLVRSPENPQYTVSRAEIASVGTYDFKIYPGQLAPGIYVITAERADSAGNVHKNTAYVYFDGSSSVHRDIMIEDYVLPTY